MSDAHDWLQDYLDDRLSVAERDRAEDRLRRDPDLRRQVEAWRGVRRALREETETLSPGFYARTRERFERSRRVGFPWGIRLISWEAAGLAAAVVLAVAIFAPDLWRHGDPTRLPSTPEGVAFESEPRQLASGDVADVEAEVDDDLGRTETGARDAKPDARRSVAEPAPEAPTTYAPSPAEARSELGALSDEALGKQEASEAFAQTPPAAPRPTGEPVLQRRKASREGEEAAALREMAEADALEAPTLGSVASRASPEVVAIPAEGVRPGVTVVEEPGDWGELAASIPALGSLGRPDRSRRLILVGRDGGVDCRTLAVEREARGYRIDAPGSADGTACAFVLSTDGIPVFFGP